MRSPCSKGARNRDPVYISVQKRTGSEKPYTAGRELSYQVKLLVPGGMRAAGSRESLAAEEVCAN